MVNEQTPLVETQSTHPLYKNGVNNHNGVTTNPQSSLVSTSSSPHFILGELIGARYLDAAVLSSATVEPYGVVQYGASVLHRTKPLVKSTRVIAASSHSPIWSIKESSLFILPLVLPRDVRNHKVLTITLWARKKATTTAAATSVVRRQSTSSKFLGKIRLKADELLEVCTEERLEYPLLDELGRLPNNTKKQEQNGNKNGSSNRQHLHHHHVDEYQPLLAVRFRAASSQDVQFVQRWNYATETLGTRIPKTVIQNVGLYPREDRIRGTLITERPLDDTGSAISSIRSRLTSSGMTLKRSRERRFRVKPRLDPDSLRPDVATVTKTELQALAEEPSRNWVEGGSGTLGKIYVEILSCHDLPNVDIGDALGNQTDAFVAIGYGDTMVQTEVIDDELSPYWPPWSQRAFVLNTLHPSQELYLGVFGYKSGSLIPHWPVGRAEINTARFRPNTTYDLRYALHLSSHTMGDRKRRGRIRLRLRIETHDARRALLAALQPPPELYVNVRGRKSLGVARYTCRGEYDNEEKFALKVLLGYIDELRDHFLRRLVYFMNDSVLSLFFWRGQVQCCGSVKLPLYSLSLFCMGILAVELPQLIPTMMCFFVAWIMLINMWLRRASPSPWYRCRSFGEYCRILLFGDDSGNRSRSNCETIKTYEGWSSHKALEAAYRQRDEATERFMKLKEAAEKEVEVAENVSKDMQSKSKASVVPMEILVILGKVQGIVGNICRILRFIDSILTWEASALSFWITLVFLAAGVAFAVLPWAFLLRWTGRILVVLLLGPQNLLWDALSDRNNSGANDDEHRIKQLLARRWFEVRCRQERAGKLKAFRHVLFGKYSTSVPPMMWTPHQDMPLPESCCYPSEEEKRQPAGMEVEKLPLVPGQKLYGLMIPRPYEDYIRNKEEAEETMESIRACLAAAAAAADTNDDIKSSERSGLLASMQRFQSLRKANEGIEVMAEYDEEATYVQKVLSPPTSPRPESVDSGGGDGGDVGVEITEVFTDEAEFVQRSWSDGVHRFPKHFDEDQDDSETEEHDEGGGGDNGGAADVDNDAKETEEQIVQMASAPPPVENVMISQGNAAGHTANNSTKNSSSSSSNNNSNRKITKNGEHSKTKFRRSTNSGKRPTPLLAPLPRQDSEVEEDLGFEVTDLNSDAVSICWSATGV